MNISELQIPPAGGGGGILTDFRAFFSPLFSPNFREHYHDKKILFDTLPYGRVGLEKRANPENQNGNHGLEDVASLGTRIDTDGGNHPGKPRIRENRGLFWEELADPAEQDPRTGSRRGMPPPALKLRRVYAKDPGKPGRKRGK